MAFGDIFKSSGLGVGIDLRPGSDDFKRALGLPVGTDPVRGAGRETDDEIIFVSSAEYRRKTGTDIRKVLFGAADAPAAAPADAPAAAPTAPPTAGGVIVVNPLLDLDLAPVRPGDLITAASFNALIAAIASLHVRLSVLEARTGSTAPPPTGTPTPTPGASTPPTAQPVKRLPPDLRTASFTTVSRNAKRRAVVFASGLRLDSITSARLLYYDIAKRQTGSTLLNKRIAQGNVAIFDLGDFTEQMSKAVDTILEVSNADGKDRIEMEKPPFAERFELDRLMHGVDDPLDLIDDIEKRLGRAISIGSNATDNIR
jgi:hypothetical protein